VVRPALFYGYDAKLDTPSHYGLLLEVIKECAHKCSLCS